MDKTISRTKQIDEEKKKYRANFLTPRPLSSKGCKKVAIMISEELNQKLLQITFIAGINKIKKGDLFENILEDHVTQNNSIIQEMLNESLVPYKQEGCCLPE